MKISSEGVKLSRILRTNDCEWWMLTLKKKPTDREDYEVANVVILYNCDEFADGRRASRLWAVFRDDIENADKDLINLLDNLRDDLGFTEQPVEVMLTRAHEFQAMTLDER